MDFEAIVAALYDFIDVLTAFFDKIAYAFGSRFAYEDATEEATSI